MTTTPGPGDAGRDVEPDELSSDAAEDPAVDPTDAGFPSSPELDDDNTQFTDLETGEPRDVTGDATE